MATIGSLVIGVMILRPYAAVGLYPATKAKLWHLSFIPFGKSRDAAPLVVFSDLRMVEIPSMGRIPRVLLARVDG